MGVPTRKSRASRDRIMESIALRLDASELLNVKLTAALHKIAFEPFGPAEATHEEVLELITQFARGVIVENALRTAIARTKS